MLVYAGNPIHPGAITTVEVPDDFDEDQKFINTVGALSLHLRDGELPLWLKTEDATLQSRLENHYKGTS